MLNGPAAILHNVATRLAPALDVPLRAHADVLLAAAPQLRDALVAHIGIADDSKGEWAKVVNRDLRDALKECASCDVRLDEALSQQAEMASWCEQRPGRADVCRAVLHGDKDVQVGHGCASTHPFEDADAVAATEAIINAADVFETKPAAEDTFLTLDVLVPASPSHALRQRRAAGPRAQRCESAPERSRRRQRRVVRAVRTDGRPQLPEPCARGGVALAGRCSPQPAPISAATS